MVHIIFKFMNHCELLTWNEKGKETKWKFRLGLCLNVLKYQSDAKFSWLNNDYL